MKTSWLLPSICLALFLLTACRTDSPAPADETPVEVEDAGPSGTVYYIERPADGAHHIMRLDLPAAEAETIYTAPELGQLHEFEVYPAGDQLIFSQTPPPSVNNGIFDRTILTTLDLTDPNAEAENLLGGEVPNEFYNMPIVSPDGRYIFYSRLGPDRLGLTGTDTFYGIERYDLETGETLPIVPNSIWPQVSPDGSKVLFIILDLPTQQRGLGIVNSDGTDPELLINIGRYFDIDSPVFAPDGESVYLSIVETQPAQSLIERIFGVSVAYAHTEHNIPSTWWELELTDDSEEVDPNPAPGAVRDPVPLDTSEVILINGRFHPTRNQMVLSTTTGLQFLSLDGEPPLLFEELMSGTTFGMLDWVDK